MRGARPDDFHTFWIMGFWVWREPLQFPVAVEQGNVFDGGCSMDLTFDGDRSGGFGDVTHAMIIRGEVEIKPRASGAVPARQLALAIRPRVAIL